MNRKLTEEYQLTERVKRRFREGVKAFSLVEPGDGILIGLSGGKDSLALVDLLGEMRRNTNRSFRVEAMHVRMENVDYRTDCGYLQDRCARNGIPLHVATGSFAPDRNEKRSPCFLCAWHRRKLLFDAAQRRGLNKIALGHHQDDILQTALMNLSFAGSFATMPALLKMRKFPVTIIRPLCKIAEADLRRWAQLNAYQPLDKACPYDKLSNRANIKKIFAEMEELNPEFRFNFWHALLKEGKLVERDAP